MIDTPVSSYISPPAQAGAGIKTRMLSREEEGELIEKWQRKHDSAAGDRLIRSFAPLVHKQVAKFRSYNVGVEDLVQEANMALLEAVRRFDRSRGIRLASYAVWWIKAALQEFVMRNTSIVRPGSTKEKKSMFFKLRYLQASMSQKAETLSASNTEVADALRLPLSDVERMDSLLRKGDFHLDAPLSNGSGEASFIFPDWRLNPEEIAADREGRAFGSRQLAAALECLDDRERRIIFSRHLSQKSETLRSLGDQLGVSPERVRQIEQLAFAKLRDCLKATAVDARDIFSGERLFMGPSNREGCYVGSA